MEFHPKTTTANFLAIRKDLYASAATSTSVGRLFRATPTSLASGNVTFHPQHETRLQLLVSANERTNFDLFASAGRVRSDVADSKLRNDVVVDDDDANDDDDDDPRLYIDGTAGDDGNNVNQLSNNGLECLDCRKTFPTKIQLSRHLKSHSTATTTTTATANPREDSSQTSLSTSTPSWRLRCNFCDSTFDRSDDLKLHEQTCGRCAAAVATSNSGTHATSSVHSTTDAANSSKTVYECDQTGCLRHYTSYSSFMKHRKTHQTTATAATGDGVTSCGNNGAVSPTDVKRHAGEKKFQCSQCSKRFPTSKDLKRHDVVHTGNREFQCSFCSHRFGRKDHRMRHEKKTHAAELSPPPPLQQQSQINPMTRQVSSSSVKNSPPQHLPPPSPPVRQASSSSSSPVLLQQQDQLVVQRQPQWSRRALTPPLPSPHGLTKLEEQHYMETIDEDPATTLSPLMEEEDSDSLSERKPLDLQKILEPATTSGADDDDPVDDDDCDDVKSGLDWIISEFMSDDDLPKNGSRETTTSSSSGFYPDVKMNADADPYRTANPSLAAAVVVPKQEEEEEIGFGDYLTRTKNPVLPSVYVDNSQPLIVPEPSKQRYHNSPRSLLFEEDDFMADVDVFLREKDIFSNI